MAEVTAQLNNYRQSPRKVRLVANAIKGKPVEQALVSLRFITKRASTPLSKLLQSAIANAKVQNMNEVFVKEVVVNEGTILYRRLPMSRGRAFPMRKRTSKVKITLAEGTGKKSKRAKRISKKKEQ